MARFVLTADVIVAAGSNPYLQPARVYKKGHTVELSAAEQTAIGGGNIRATTIRDALGLSYGVSNSA